MHIALCCIVSCAFTAFGVSVFCIIVVPLYNCWRIRCFSTLDRVHESDGLTLPARTPSELNLCLALPPHSGCSAAPSRASLQGPGGAAPHPGQTASCPRQDPGPAAVHTGATPSRPPGYPRAGDPTLAAVLPAGTCLAPMHAQVALPGHMVLLTTLVSNTLTSCV